MARIWIIAEFVQPINWSLKVIYNLQWIVQMVYKDSYKAQLIWLVVWIRTEYTLVQGVHS